MQCEFTYFACYSYVSCPNSVCLILKPLGCSFRPALFLLLYLYFLFIAEPQDGDIRLYPEARVSVILISGHLEVYYDGEWGTVCADQLDINDAHEVCRQLGYNGSISALGLTANRKGTGPVNNNDENCSESEARLAVCSHPGIGIEDGSHGEDAVAACEGMPGQFS